MVRTFAVGLCLQSISGMRVSLQQTTLQDNHTITSLELQGVKQVIGESHDITRVNLWTFENMYGIDLFSNMPDSCIEAEPCQHGLSITSKTFDSTGSWTKHFASSFGLEAKGSVGYGIDVSISASTGKSFDDTGFSERNYYHHKVWNRKACWALSNECLSNPAYLSPSVKKALVRMDVNKADLKAMRKWSKYFIRLYGSHVIIATTNGAAVQSVSSQESTCHSDAACLKQKMCASIGYMEQVSAEICGKKDACDEKDNCEDTYSESCIVRGGALDSKARVCLPKVSKEALQEFLEGGDLSQGSSAIGYKFMPMSTVLMYMGLFEEAEMVEKAVEFHSCKAPRHQWTASATGEHTCECALTCENGGVLDESACVCKCRGDMLHGFKGITCSETYGTCQPGAGTGHESHAAKCAQSNFCASHFWKQQCNVTDVCCLTPIGGACCPYGSACDCDANDCKCITK